MPNYKVAVAGIILTSAATFFAPAARAQRADLPVKEVVLYKHGVGFFVREGAVKAGETVRLEFKASDMNDVLKSLTLNGGRISGVRYEASDPIDKRLAEFPFAVRPGTSLAAFLDQLKGSHLELSFGQQRAEGDIVSGRQIDASDKSPEREMVTLLMATGELRTFDLGSAVSVRLTDPKLQTLFRDYLAVQSAGRSQDKRSVFVESSAAGNLAASYLTPAAVWKSSYRLLFPATGDPTLEGWAIVDNTSGEDWDGVRLSVVSGRPISFISRLFEPKYVQRRTADVDDGGAAAPVTFGGVIGGVVGGLPGGAGGGGGAAQAPPPPPTAMRAAAPKGEFLSVGGLDVARLKAESSSVSGVADGKDAGELFEYDFPTSVTVKRGESAMLPFLQQKVGGKKLTVYNESYGLHPMNAAEISNGTGKTLDGGPITVYDGGSYAGEALVETVKTGDKRLIAYGVDLGTRVTTAFDATRETVREIHYSRGVLTAKTASEEAKTFTMTNVDAKEKTVIVEYPVRRGYALLAPTARERAADSYRFEVKVGANATATLAVREERVYDQSVSITNATPDSMGVWIQNKQLSDAGRRALDQIAAKKREVAGNAAAITENETAQRTATDDQGRFRLNLQTLNGVAGQQEQVQNYSRQLADTEVKIATLRDAQAALRASRTSLAAELADLIDRAAF